MICAYNLYMPEDFQCPSCKVVIARSSQDTHGLLKPQRQSCPYCGSRLDYSSSRESRRPSLTDQDDLRRSSSAMRRSASAHLPALIQSRPAAADTVFNGFVISQLGRVTLGPIGITTVFDSQRLPYLPTDSSSKNLVSSGSTSPNTTSADLSKSKRPKYNTETRLTRSEFSKMFSYAKKTKEWSEVEDFYTLVFQSASNLVATFKKELNQHGAKMDSPDLKSDLLHSVLDKVEHINGNVQKSMLKSMVTCLLDLESVNLYAKDKTRALFILLQNPIFSSQSTYTIYAHLLQHLTSLTNGDHQLLVHWFRTLSNTRFKAILRSLLQFVTIRQFPPADKSLPPLSKSRWWIPTATKVMALLNAANNLG